MYDHGWKIGYERGVRDAAKAAEEKASHVYGEDIFPPESQSVDARSADWARRVLRHMAVDILALLDQPGAGEKK
jgi:hypothetical protein